MKKIFLSLCAVLAVLVFYTPATALHLEPTPGVSLDFYATNNFQTEYKFESRSDSATEEDELQWDISNTFGGFAKTKNFYGKWELGFKGPSGSNSIYSRLLYGSYSFNNTVKLSMGQMYFPNYWWTYSNTKAGNAGTGYGISQVARTPQIRIDFGPAYIIAASVNESTISISDATTTRQIPRIYAGFDTSIGKHKIGAGFGYNSHDIKSTALGMDTTLDSWTAFVHGQVALTDTVLLKSQVFYAQNAPQFGIYGHGSMATTGGAETSADAQVNGANIENSNTLAGFVHVKANMSSDMAIFGGYGYSTSENDLVSNGESNPKQEYYVGANITIYEIKDPHVKMYVVPEIHVFDYMDDESGSDEGGDLYAGARWKLKF